MEFKQHELCMIPDAHSPAELAKIESSIRERGFDQDEAITLYEGKILDGWGRYQASKLAGVEPVFKLFVGDSNSTKTVHQQAADYCFYKLLARRHVPMGRQAALAILYNKHRMETGELPLTHGELAKVSGASSSYIAQASSVEKREPERLEKIVHGEQSLPRAYRELQQSLPEAINHEDKLADVWATKAKWQLVIARLQELGERDIDPLRARRGSEVIVESMASKLKENGQLKLGKTFVEYSIEQIKANMPDRPCENCHGEGCEVCRHRGWWTAAESKARAKR